VTIKLALPTGDPRAAVGELLERAGIPAPGYEASSRLLRSVNEGEGLTVRIFREKDIPIQVALGNYDLGICGDVWLSELQVRFPEQRLARIGSLPGPRTEVWLCAAPESGLSAGQTPAGLTIAGARIASELPNLADLLAVHLRIPGYQLLSVYGSADAYAPEDADLALLPVANEEGVVSKGMAPLHRLFGGGLALIANADALRSKDLGSLLSRLAPNLAGDGPELSLPAGLTGLSMAARPERRRDIVRLALPDGHAQRHTYANLLDAGFHFEGYDEKSFVRRPKSGIPGLDVKVLRPQDMPQLVAMGMFDIAITGVDWLTEIKSRFPSAPVEMAVDLGRSRYKIGPVVDQAFPADDTASALAIWRGLGRPVRIASEFPALAEAFARSVHLPFTTIIPIAGASEGFVPEDADILIEGSETGASIRANNLKMLDPFMESTNCVIVRRDPVTTQAALLADLLERFRKAAAAVTTA
jgi:ATP phosphoribosyltransferase